MLFAARFAAGIALSALCLVPAERLAGGPVLCLFKRLFGIECLGCGMTRAISAALHLEFGRAMDANSLVAVVLPALLVFVAAPARFWTALAGVGRQFQSPALRRSRV